MSLESSNTRFTSRNLVHGSIVLVFLLQLCLISESDASSSRSRIRDRYLANSPEMKLYEALYRIQMERPRIHKKALISYQREIDICPSVTEWRNLTSAYASDGRHVQIVQGSEMGRQWFYTVSCKSAYENQPCRLISSEHSTSCRTRYNLVPAFAQVREETEPDPYQFVMIRIPSQCVCVEMATVDVDDARWMDGGDLK